MLLTGTVFCRELLDETGEVTLTSSWKEIKKLVKDDPRYNKFSSSDRVSSCLIMQITWFSSMCVWKAGISNSVAMSFLSHKIINTRKCVKMEYR